MEEEKLPKAEGVGERSEQIQKVACNFVRSIGENPDAYLVRVEKDSSDFKVLFIPKRMMILGGGFRVYVKKDMNIKDIVYLQ
jgi:hypothetical protein